MAPSLRRWQMRKDRALEEEQAFVGDQEFPAAFRRAGGMVIQVGAPGKLQGYRKFPGCFLIICQPVGEVPTGRGRESPWARPA